MKVTTSLDMAQPTAEGLKPAGSPALPEHMTVETKEPTKLFISYCDRPENEYLVETIVRQFLSLLNFDVRTWKDARSSALLKNEIDRLIDESRVLLAFLTKDIKEESVAFHPKSNIPEEMSRARTRSSIVIGFAEEGTTIPSNVGAYFCHKFVNEPKKYAELLIELLVALKREKLL